MFHIYLVPVSVITLVRVVKKRLYPSYADIPDGDTPFSCFRNPYGFFYLVLQPYIFVDLVLAGKPLPVIPNFVSLCKLLRPLRIRCKSRLVYMRWHIASYTRICVFVPCASLTLVNTSHTLLHEGITIPTTSAFLSKIRRSRPGNLAGKRMPAVIPPMPAPMTPTLIFRTSSIG